MSVNIAASVRIQSCLTASKKDHDRSSLKNKSKKKKSNCRGGPASIQRSGLFRQSFDFPFVNHESLHVNISSPNTIERSPLC